MIRVILTFHLRTVAHAGSEVRLEVVILKTRPGHAALRVRAVNRKCSGRVRLSWIDDRAIASPFCYHCAPFTREKKPYKSRLTPLRKGGTLVDIPAIEKFRATVRGIVLCPGQDGYDAARTIPNAMIDRRPAIVARCTGVADAIACVRFAREHDLLVSVRGGGHSVAGKSVCDGGLMIDLSTMKGIRVDPARRTVRAETGLTLGEFDRETQAFGLATTLGVVSRTGIAGLTLGGGWGHLCMPSTAWLSTTLLVRTWLLPMAACLRQMRRRTKICSGACAAAAAISESSRRWNTAC